MSDGYTKAGVKRIGAKGPYSGGPNTTPPAGKETSDKSVQFAKGGTTNMFGRQHADQMDSGVTGHCVSGNSGKFTQGGKTKMFGKGSASPMQPGHTGKAQN